MGERIETFFDPKVFEDIERFKTGVDENVESLKKLFVASTDLETQFRKSSKEVGDAETARKKLTEAEEAAKKIAVEQQKAAEALERQRQQGLKVMAKVEYQERQMKEALDKEVKSIKDAREQNIALRKIRSDVDITTEEGRKTLEEYNKKIDENDKLIKESVDSYTQQKINIGNYEEAIRNALEATDAFKGGTSNVINNFIGMSQQEGGIKGFFQTFVSGIGSATKAGLKFIATPIGAVIALIVTGIGLLTSAVKRNQGASDTFNKVWKGISTVIEEVIGRVFKLVGALGKLVSGDFKGFAKQSKEAFTGMGQAISYAYQEGQKLAQLQIELEQNTIKATKAVAEYNGIAQQSQIIADDTTKSFAEREAAAERARIALRNSALETVGLAKQELEILNMRVKQSERQGKINRELLQEQASAYAEYINAENELTAVTMDNERTRSELKQDRLERDLDILIDGYDNVKTVNERIIANERKTFNERQELLLETARLGTESFDKQIETIKQFTDVQFNANELLAEQDAIRLNQRIRELGLSEIIEGRLLEIIRERRIVVQDLIEAQNDLTDSLIDTNDISNSIAEDDKKRLEEFDKMIEESANDEMQLLIDKNELEADLAKDSIEWEERKRQAKLQTLQTIVDIFGKESAIGKAATAIQQAEAIRQNLISLGVITSKQAEAQAKSAAAAPFPFNLPLIAATVAQFVGIIRTFRSGTSRLNAFAKGVKSSPHGVALVGEEGFELGIPPNGKPFVTGNQPELRFLQGGTQIIPHAESKRILKDVQTGNNTNKELIQAFMQGNILVANEIRRSPKFRVLRSSRNSLEARYGNTVKKYNDIQFG